MYMRKILIMCYFIFLQIAIVDASVIQEYNSCSVEGEFFDGWYVEVSDVSGECQWVIPWNIYWNINNEAWMEEWVLYSFWVAEFSSLGEDGESFSWYEWTFEGNYFTTDIQAFPLLNTNKRYRVENIITEFQKKIEWYSLSKQESILTKVDSKIELYQEKYSVSSMQYQLLSLMKQKIIK